MAVYSLTGNVSSPLQAEPTHDQQPFIVSAVESQTRKAVTALEPTIRSSVDNVTQEQVKRSVAPIESQMKQYGDLIRIGSLITLARGDDRKSFEYLFQIVWATHQSPRMSN